MPAATTPSAGDGQSASPPTALPSTQPSPSPSADPPERPPVSPITPVASIAKLAPIRPSASERRFVPPPASTFMQQPPLVPISESDNPDAIALRSAISLLQLQREKSKQDLKTLEEIKSAAVSDPEGFVRALQAQRSTSINSTSDVLSPTLSGSFPKENDIAVESASHGGPEELTTAKFPTIPKPQNIVRCPPINWAKYHVVGGSLDKLHEQQKKFPGSVDPPAGARASGHAIAAPYSPFLDGVGDTSSQQRRTSKKATP